MHGCPLRWIKTSPDQTFRMDHHDTYISSGCIRRTHRWEIRTSENLVRDAEKLVRIKIPMLVLSANLRCLPRIFWWVSLVSCPLHQVYINEKLIKSQFMKELWAKFEDCNPQICVLRTVLPVRSQLHKLFETEGHTLDLGFPTSRI